MVVIFVVHKPTLNRDPPLAVNLSIDIINHLCLYNIVSANCHWAK